MRIIAVANQKGGCGKTTIVINLAACLAREGQRTLAVDLDPQGHCALGLLVPEEQIEVNIADVLVADSANGAPDMSRVTWQISSHFDLIPAKTDLCRLEQKLALQAEDARAGRIEVVDRDGGRDPEAARETIHDEMRALGAERVDTVGGQARDRELAAKLAVEAVDSLHEMAGANGIYDHSPLQRVFRDQRSAAGHFSFSTDAQLPPWGLVAMGGEYSSPTL